MYETMNNQCFELTPLSRWYGQRHIVSLSRWNTYAPLMAKVQSHLPGLTLRQKYAPLMAKVQRRRLTSSEEILRRQALLILSLLPTSERDHRAGKRHHRERDHRVGERDHGREALNVVGSRLRKKSSEDKPSSS